MKHPAPIRMARPAGSRWAYHAAEAAVFVTCLVVLGALVMVWGAPI